MPLLYSNLPADECVRRLREQVQRRTILSRLNIFRPPRSRVIGEVSPTGFSLESSFDPFSKRLVGTLVSQPEGTIIDYSWQTPLTHRIYGHSHFDEEQILSFLTEWLDAQPL